MKRKIKVILTTVLLALLVTGCGTSKKEASNGEKVVKVGTMGVYEPFSFEDKNGKLTGYDIEVLRAIDPLIDSVKFEYIASPWDTLFVGLDSDRFQLLANEITSNPERVARYTLTKNSYFKDMSQPIVLSSNKTINSLKDLEGKKVGITVGDSHAIALEKYNSENGNKIKIEYYETDINTILQDLLNGRIDATINNPIMAKEKAKVQNIDIRTINESIIESPSLFIAKKDKEGKKLIADIDKALETIKKDGTLSKLSKEWFGQDYTN